MAMMERVRRLNDSVKVSSLDLEAPAELPAERFIVTDPNKKSERKVIKVSLSFRELGKPNQFPSWPISSNK